MTTRHELAPTNTQNRTKVAFLGLGAMGARMASRLLRDSIDLKVWNRSGVPQGAASPGAVLAPTPAVAVQGADVVIAMVTDDAASRTVWLDSGVLKAMRPGAVVVECSTLSPGWVSELRVNARAAALHFVDAPVVGSRPQAEAGALIFLAGGDVATVEALRPILLCMGSAVHHLGDSPAGAYAKLVVNALFMSQVAVLAELLGFARNASVDVSKLLEALGGLPVLSPSAKAAAAGMQTKTFAPMFPLRLALKDLRYALSAAVAASCKVPMLQSLHEVFDGGARRGLLDENLTAVAKLYAEAGS